MLNVLLELGEGKIPVFIFVNTIEIAAMRILAIRMISIISITSRIVYDNRGVASTYFTRVV